MVARGGERRRFVEDGGCRRMIASSDEGNDGMMENVVRRQFAVPQLQVSGGFE
jgi:hypothetical protein